MSQKKNSWWWLLLFLIPIIAFVVWAVLAFSGNDVSFNAKREVKQALAELRKDPHSFTANMRAGVGYYNLGLFNQSVQYYETATSIDPGSPDAWNNLGNTYRELLRHDDAEAAYKRAEELKPDEATAYLNLAELYRRWPKDEKDRSKEIAKVLVQGLQATKSDRAILHALVDYYEGINDSKSADLYRAQLDASPESPA